jgi:hypothetical protein
VFAAVQSMTLANAIANSAPVANPVQVQGQVAGRDATGQTLIKTDAGMLALKLPTPMPLPQGATVTLQLGGTAAAPQAQIVQVQPPQAGAAQQPAQAQPPPAPAQTPAAQIAQTAQNKPNVRIAATLVSPPATPPAANLPVLQNGASVQLRVLPSPAATVGTPAPQVLTSQAAPTLLARVVAHTPGGQTLLDTPMGRLAATWPAGLPRPAEGASVTVELPLPPIAGKATSDAANLKSSAPLAREWPTLKEALKTLGDADPGLARRMLEDGIPKPGPKLALQVMSYLANERTDARGLLGDAAATAIERAGKGEILQRLDGDLKEMQRQATASNDWRVAYVPFQDGVELRQMRLFSRREGQKNKRERDAKRFVVEIDFSEMGEIQIDGLMRKPRLELMLRTRKAIPADLRDEIEIVFLEGCSLAGLAGQIYFQAVDRFPVNPLDDIARQNRGVIA